MVRARFTRSLGGLLCLMSMIGLDQYYYLLQACDALGRRLFGSKWSPQDFTQPRLDPPEILAERRAPIERRLDEVNARDDEIEAAPSPALKRGA